MEARGRIAEVDVAVIGGGPAGATAGRLLAEWGHSVVIASRPPAAHSLAESLPPSIRRLLRHVGALDLVEGAGFLPARGNTSWWGTAEPRVERFPGAPGYQVLRRHLDRLLLDAARAAGARTLRGATVRRVELLAGEPAVIEHARPAAEPSRLRARFVLDCSGRSGVLARRVRVKDERLATVALSAVWRHTRGFAAADWTHTLVEAYRDGWAWSVPVSRQRRHVAFMVDPRPAGRPLPAAARYRAELEKAAHLRERLAGAALVEPPWACDASVYGARSFGGPGFLLVGDAGSFLDPMSSFGVKKALASAWMAAVVANTCLSRPERAAVASALFSEREREMAAALGRESARYLREAAAAYGTPFWRRRAEAASSAGEPGAAVGGPEVRAAFERLRREPMLWLRPGEGLRQTRVPEVRGREVVLAAAVAAPALPEGVRYVRGVRVPALLRLLPFQGELPRLFDAYNRLGTPAALPDFLAALAFLAAKGVLRQG